MFNIGLGEMIVIGLIALLVFGPERLPELARQAAQLFNQVRGAADEVQRAILT
ncbi:MAG: twin-arginine translocase TatA/TatE family subunit, partial [Ardenticatenales bacterium]|nr:twin-arginine translocase TatA/TatE family subunit [Ardenticatenales bacterium]